MKGKERIKQVPGMKKTESVDNSGERWCSIGR